MDAEPTAQPLADLLVLDMTSLAMGPLAAQTLGDYGADVVKVEPLAGDAFRQTIPMNSPNMGHAYLQFNRNKRSLAINLKAPAAQTAFRKLIEKADIIVSNVRSSGMRGLGLDYESVAAINPNIIYCAAYGYSERGPYAGRPAADDTIQAISGLASIQGRMAGQPQFVASVVADKAAGLTLCNAILAAIIHRMKTGRGQFIELSMFEAMVSFVLPEHLAGLTYDPPRGESGYNRIMNPMRRPFATKDGFLSVLPYTTPQWQRFFQLIGRNDLAEEPELAVAAKRNARTTELYGLIEQAMPDKTTKEWVALLLDADILIGEVLSPEQLVVDPHLEATGLFALIDHPTEGRIRLMNPPVWSSESPTKLALLPPTLGQHSREILFQAGLEANDFDALVQAGHVIQS